MRHIDITTKNKILLQEVALKYLKKRVTIDVGKTWHINENTKIA